MLLIQSIIRLEKYLKNTMGLEYLKAKRETDISENHWWFEIKDQNKFIVYLSSYIKISCQLFFINLEPKI